MPKRVGTNMLAAQRKKSRYSATNVTSRNLRAMLPRSLIPETKWKDYAASSGVATAFLSLPTSNIAQGDDYNERIGKKVTLKSLDCSVYCAAQAFRVTVLIPKNPTFNPTGLGGLSGFTGRYSHNDFWIIADHLVSADQSMKRLIVPLKDRVRHYGSSTSSTDVDMNNVIVAVNVANSANVVMGARLYYTD